MTHFHGVLLVGVAFVLEDHLGVVVLDHILVLRKLEEPYSGVVGVDEELLVVDEADVDDLLSVLFGDVGVPALEVRQVANKTVKTMKVQKQN